MGDEKHKQAFAEKMVNLVVCKNSEGKPEYKPEGLIVAAFMSKGGEDDGMV